MVAVHTARRSSLRKPAPINYAAQTLSDHDEEADVRVKKPSGTRADGVTWLADEDERLTAAFARFGPRWVEVSKYVPGRSVAMCRNRWARMRGQGQRAGVKTTARNRCGKCGEIKRGHTCYALFTSAAARPVRKRVKSGGASGAMCAAVEAAREAAREVAAAAVAAAEEAEDGASVLAARLQDPLVPHVADGAFQIRASDAAHAAASAGGGWLAVAVDDDASDSDVEAELFAAAAGAAGAADASRALSRALTTPLAPSPPPMLATPVESPVATPFRFPLCASAAARPPPIADAPAGGGVRTGVVVGAYLLQPTAAAAPTPARAAAALPRHANAPPLPAAHGLPRHSFDLGSILAAQPSGARANEYLLPLEALNECVLSSAASGAPPALAAAVSFSEGHVYSEGHVEGHVEGPAEAAAPEAGHVEAGPINLDAPLDSCAPLEAVPTLASAGSSWSRQPSFSSYFAAPPLSAAAPFGGREPSFSFADARAAPVHV